MLHDSDNNILHTKLRTIRLYDQILTASFVWQLWPSSLVTHKSPGIKARTCTLKQPHGAKSISTKVNYVLHVHSKRLWRVFPSYFIKRVTKKIQNTHRRYEHMVQPRGPECKHRFGGNTKRRVSMQNKNKDHYNVPKHRLLYIIHCQSGESIIFYLLISRNETKYDYDFQHTRSKM